MSKPFNTTMMNQLMALGARKPCFKTGFASPEAAMAQLRSIRKLDDRKPQRDLDKLNVYKCANIVCLASGKPYHTGHAHYPQNKNRK